MSPPPSLGSTSPGESIVDLTGVFASIRVRLRGRHTSALCCPFCKSSLKYVGTRSWQCPKEGLQFSWNPTTLTYTLDRGPQNAPIPSPAAFNALPEKDCGGILGWDNNIRRWRCLLCKQIPPANKRGFTWQVTGSFATDSETVPFFGDEDVMWKLLKRFTPDSRQMIIDKLGTPWRSNTPQAWATFKAHLDMFNRDLEHRRDARMPSLTIIGLWHFRQSSEPDYFIVKDISTQTQLESQELTRAEEYDTGMKVRITSQRGRRKSAWTPPKINELIGMIKRKTEGAGWSLSTWGHSPTANQDESNADIITLTKKYREHEIRISVYVGKRYGEGYRWWLAVDRERILPMETRTFKFFGTTYHARHFTVPHTKEAIKGNEEILTHLLSHVDDAITYKERSR